MSHPYSACKVTTRLPNTFRLKIRNPTAHFPEKSYELLPYLRAIDFKTLSAADISKLAKKVGLRIAFLSNRNKSPVYDSSFADGTCIARQHEINSLKSYAKILRRIEKPAKPLGELMYAPSFSP